MLSRNVSQTVWRITSARYGNRAFDGEGARLYGGRWNQRGVAIAYCSWTLSLAALEYFVHLEPDLAPPDLMAVGADLPLDLSREILEAAALPENWRSYPAPEPLQDIGTGWVRSRRTAILQVPSVVIPQEMNVLINPAHPDFAKIQIRDPEPFSFDPRMW